MKPTKGKGKYKRINRTSTVNNSKNKNHNLYNKNNIHISLNQPSNGGVPQNATGHFQRAQTLFQPTPMDTSYVIPQLPSFSNNFLQHNLAEQANLHRVPV